MRKERVQLQTGVFVGKSARKKMRFKTQQSHAS
jgi:hypothetical protein